MAPLCRQWSNDRGPKSPAPIRRTITFAAESKCEPRKVISICPGILFPHAVQTTQITPKVSQLKSGNS